MKIIIPMAGHSERFRSAGYTVPKPFIIIDGKPMIHWVCDLFLPEDDFVFIIQKEHGKNSEFMDILKSATPRNRIVQIEPHKYGPIYTTLAADEAIARDEPLIFVYSDFYQHWNYRQFLRRVEGYDGAMTVFKGFHPASFGDTYYAYLRCNEKGEMLEIREKGCFTEMRHEEPASSGVYYVRSWQVFKRFAERLMAERASVEGEYYTSQIYNYMVEEGLRVVTYEIDKFICWGTPDDLEQYLFWSDFFRNDAVRMIEGGRSA
jgi:NDP-sugar pyrophosphorylase family protein